jgi:hypothetical protein
MNGIENKTQSAVRIDEIASPKAAVYRALLKVMMKRKKRKRWKQRVKRIMKNLQETR